MCFKFFERLAMRKPKYDLGEMPTMTKGKVIKELEYDILIHENWAVTVTENPTYAPSFGDYDFHMRWIEVYKNSIHYLRG